jgi:hypothetical protein
MKADSGSWLYIILSIVFIVISAISNKNKKKASTSTPPINDEPASQPQRSWPRNFEEVLTEVLDLPKPKPQEVIVEQPRSPYGGPLENTQNSYEKIETEAQSLETIETETFTYEAPVVETKKVEKPVSKEQVENKKEKQKEESALVFGGKEFDLRQGIIYTEILNRKYF